VRPGLAAVRGGLVRLVRGVDPHAPPPHRTRPPRAVPPARRPQPDLDRPPQPPRPAPPPLPECLDCDHPGPGRARRRTGPDAARHARRMDYPAYAAAASDELAHRRSEEHTSELQSRENLVCRLLLEKKKQA